MQSIADFFGLDSSTELTWCHGLVTREALMTAAADPSLHVAVGTVRYAPGEALPMMAETQDSPSDLDVVTWVATMHAAGKAIKLDFLEPSAVEPTLQLLHRFDLATPLMLHGNVFALLPHSQRVEGIEPDQFFKQVQRYAPKAIISLGWSLKRTHDADGRLEESLIEQMADMSLHRLGGGHYGIEIRAGYTPGHERGAAMIFEPMDGLDAPVTRFGDGNVVDASARFRRAA